MAKPPPAVPTGAIARPENPDKGTPVRPTGEEKSARICNRRSNVAYLEACLVSGMQMVCNPEMNIQ